MSLEQLTFGKRFRALAAGLLGMSLLASGCSGGTGSGDATPGTSDGSPGDLSGVTIRLAGPNQWNADTKSFGPFWDDLTKRFKDETGITVETTVLPISEFSNIISTQLAAGTAPELVFNQPPHDPQSVVPLDDYMKKPNPFIEGNTEWYKAFNSEFFGYDAGSVNGQGKLEWVPFNLIGLGIFYNQEIMDEAGVTPPLKTYGDFLTACDKLKEKGYAGFAMDASLQGQGQVTNIIGNMMTAKYFDEWNVYKGDGTAGKAENQLPAKSEARAIGTGEYSTTKTPEVAEVLRLVKGFMDRCATPNWSGIQPSSGGFVNTGDFVGKKAAMALGSNLAAANGVLSFKYGTMPFGTVSKEDSPLSTGFAAQSGLGAGGTSYMISSSSKGQQLEAAVKFLQFASSPKGIQPFLDASGGVPAILDAKPAPGLEGFIENKDWTHTLLMGDFGTYPKTMSGQPVIDGYLIGQESLEDQLAEMQKLWTQSVKEQIKDNGWTDDWVSKVS